MCAPVCLCVCEREKLKVFAKNSLNKQVARMRIIEFVQKYQHTHPHIYIHLFRFCMHNIIIMCIFFAYKEQNMETDIIYLV